MKDTAILLDTNVVLDWILKREPFRTNSESIIELCINGEVHGYLACHTILNLFFILRKDYSVAERKEILMMLCNDFNIIGIDHEILMTALCDENFRDIEDDVQIQCALFEDLDYIVTRDINGFKDSKIKAILPEDFLAWRRRGNYA